MTPAARHGGGFDRRLLRYTASTRRYLAAACLIGTATAALVVAQAALVALVVSGVVVGHRSLDGSAGALVALGAVEVGRAVVAWTGEWVAHRASAGAQSELRRAVVGRLAAVGSPDRDAGRDAGSRVAVVLGLDALDGFFGRYLPQLVLAVVVPVAIVAVLVGDDWVSALVVAATVPLIPVFMALVGAATGERTSARLAALRRLAGHFLDVVTGLPTLKVFGRAKAQVEAIAIVTERYRVATLATLRLTFLSALVLELLATVSVALVAVAVGLRLLGGHLTFRTALFVLVLAPEAYLPLRNLGSGFHAAADGVAAAGRALDLVDPGSGDDDGAVAGSAPGTVLGSRPARRSMPSDDGIEVEDLAVTHPGRSAPAPDGVSLVVAPGETVAVVGPSGCGKSTLLEVILGLREPSAGSVRIGGVAIGELDLEEWRARVAWLPQRPHLFARSLAENVRVARPGATDRQVARAVETVGLGPTVARLADGVDTRLGAQGAGLSMGERQRLALARVVVSDAPVLLLDEPTAHLDVETERIVADAVRRLVVGRTAVVVAHRPALAAAADRVVDLGVRTGVG